jgi:hypothetical protein
VVLLVCSVAVSEYGDAQNRFRAITITLYFLADYIDRIRASRTNDRPINDRPNHSYFYVCTRLPVGLLLVLNPVAS